ncbi:hypothetical protein NDU88_002110 [Pleurodeles waltl]|uniref:Uncharacterized protein n=1 Tax=Pleurodeles waltl TaxID=8319 RepID=A0AAV7VA96_PLEWA|nr:hypothetical protein NDU88_002110 [Pleurodeles waltl]
MHALNMSFFLPPPFFVVFLFMCALASLGGGEVASDHEGAASHMAPEGHATDSEFTSETEGEESSTTGTRGDVSDTDTSRKGAPLWWQQHPCPLLQQVQPPPRAPAPPSKQSLSVRPVPARPGSRASPSPQAPQALPQLPLLPSVRRSLTSSRRSLLGSLPL